MGVDNKIFTIYGIWLLLGKQDSPKFGHRCKIEKENDIRVYVQGLEGYSRDPGLARNTLLDSEKRPISLSDAGIDRYSGSGIRQNLKENGIRDRDDRSSGRGIVVKESGNTGSGPPVPPPPTFRLLVYSNPGSLLNIPLTNQTTYTYNPAQLSLIFYSTSR